MASWRRVVIGTAGLALLGSSLGACGGSGSSPAAVAAAFTAAWDRGDWAVMRRLVAVPAPDFATAGPAVEAALHASAATHSTGVVPPGGATRRVPLTNRYTLPGGIGTWSVSSAFDLVKRSGKWLVVWSPAVVDPALKPGDHLSLERVWAPRAAITGAGGAPLTTQAPQVVVGVEGSRVKDRAALTQVLIAAGATSTEVASALAAATAHPTFFEPVFVLSEARYQQLGGQTSALYQAPGTVFQHSTARTAVTPGLAAHLVGSVGPVTAEQLRSLGPGYDASSVVGRHGIEAEYEKQLAGTPGADIVAVDAGGRIGSTLATFAPKAGTPVATTIDPKVQAAAESALAPVAGSAALVAVRASTGEVLASVSQPAGAPFDQALGGAFPPGSTFKVVTSTALIMAGFSPASPASCPPTATVGGEVFHNAEGDAPVSDLAGAFTESCNTAFVQLAAAHLKAATLPAAAALFGIGTAPHMGVPAFAGDVPTPPDAAALAASSIGQAKVVVSPLNMAVVAAAVDSGATRAPRLVAGAADDTAPARPLPPAVVSGLRTMMAQVVQSGTAAGTGLPSGTHAKTGTAEYGSGTPQPTDAWLIGYDGDLAFAVVVQGTGNGGPTDGPIIARFLTALGSQA